MKANQKGFSAVGALIIVVIVAVIGGVGWYVWEGRDKKQATQDSTTNSTTQATVPVVYNRTTTVPKNWKTYTNKEYKLTLAYPASWTISDSTFNKKAGDDEQNVYSVNATKIFVVCYKSPDARQWCPAQININNQPYAQSLAQLRKYYNSASDTPYKETKVLIDGHEATEFRTEAKGGLPAQKEYLVNANGFSYGLTTVYEGELARGSQQELSANDSLILFESIKID